MCGLCGILRLGESGPPDDPGLLDRMTDSLAHRGPSDRGTWSDERIGLGSRRLSVIDLSPNGRMPLGNEDGTVQVAYNGEVYNFRELKERFRLEERGHRFRSRTDTEVLVHLYEELGLDMLRHLNGMFAIAIWDARRRALHLVRDRYGVKPLFYQRDAHRFRFGSEIKAILADPRVARRPSLQALHDFLTYDYVPGAQTAFEDILEVPPAHCLTVLPDGTEELTRWWDLSFEPDPSITAAQAAAKALELMRKAVERRLIADVPIGVMLSGGMDSSTVVALMAERGGEPVRTYSVGFEDPSFDELRWARLVAKRFGTVHREVVVTSQMVRDMLPGYLRYIDEPYADGSAIPTYYVCGMAKDEVVVVLSGEGGDEAFAGYETYAAFKTSQWARRVPRWLRAGVIAPLVNRLPVSHSKLSLEFKLKRFLGGLDLDPIDAHVWWRVVLSEERKREIYSPAVLERLGAESPLRHFRDAYRRGSRGDPLAGIMYGDSRVFLPDDLMIKNDRMSMAHSLEARVPFVDFELTEFMARVPAAVKFPGLRKKRVMIDAMRGLLPEEILTRKKVGLEMPYSRWLRTDLADLVDLHLGTDRLAETGLFRPEGVRTLVEEHAEGRFDHGRALWGLLNYMMWHGLYL